MGFQNDMYKQRAYWPRHLVVPLEKEFVHGEWIKSDEESLRDIPGSFENADEESCGTMSKARAHELRYSCNTQCCLVGWVALAFGEKGANPDSFSNPASAKFLNKFIELTGSTPVDPADFYRQKEFIVATAERASDLFEGFDYSADWRPVGTLNALTAKEARSLWKKAGASFNYDTENLVE